MNLITQVRGKLKPDAEGEKTRFFPTPTPSCVITAISMVYGNVEDKEKNTMRIKKRHSLSELLNIPAG